jgi:murein DD-endopeptidase MepM/ murein hydrolase activator NlpD
MGKFDKVKKNIKRKKRAIHFSYIISFIIVLLVGLVIGIQYEKTKLDELHKLGSKYNKDVNELQNIVENKISEAAFYKMYLDSIPFGPPINIVQIASDYGYRIDPFDTIIQFHQGIDLNAKHCQAIISTAAGIIKTAKYVKGYGLCVKIKHIQGYSTLYAHLNEILVNEGTSVKKGDTIGLAGSTGRSTSVHLHYEVQKEHLPLDPEDFIKIVVKSLDSEK